MDRTLALKIRLSERQRRMLRFISGFIREKGYPPTIREIGMAVGISSTSVVNYNLGRLEEKGYIERDRFVTRGMRLLKPAIDLPVGMDRRREV